MRGLRSGSGAVAADGTALPSPRSLTRDPDRGRDHEHELMLWEAEMARLEERISALGHTHETSAEAAAVDAQRVRLIAQLEWLRISRPEPRATRLPPD